MAIVKGPDGYSINHQHEYATLRTPYGNYTRSYSSDKLSGRLCNIDGLLGRLDSWMKTYMKNKPSAKFGEALEALMKNFEIVVPEVREFGPVEKIEVDDIVTVPDFGQYPGEYVVQSVKKTTATLKVGDSLIGFPLYLLKNTGKKVNFNSI